jgi:outer membrane protein assembly factor BamB
MGRIACFETATGNEKWAVNIVDDFGSEVPYFGYAESVIVDEEKVYSFAGGQQNNMVALNRFTGETIWSSEALKDTFSYCSPVVVNLPERKVLVLHSRHHIYAVDCSNGAVTGSYFWNGYEYDGEHCNPPVYADGSVYFIGNDEKGKGAIKLELGENGESLEEVWFNNKIMNNFNGYVKIGDHLFTTVQGNWLKALKDETGQVTDSVKVATGSIIYADNRFYCYGMNGDVNLVQYNPDGFKITGSFKVREGDGQHFSHPVINNETLFIRHGNALIAYKIA